MAMQDLSYTQVAPDAIQIQRPGIAPLTVVGPEADRWKQRIDAFRAQAPQPVAGPGTGIDAGAGGMSGMGADPGMTPANVGAGAPPVEVGPAGAGGAINAPDPTAAGGASPIETQRALRSLGETPQVPEQPQVAAPQAVSQPQLGPRYMFDPKSGKTVDRTSGEIVEIRRGTAGISQEQLQQRAEQSVAQPSSMQVQEGMRVPQELQDAFQASVRESLTQNEQMRQLNLQKAEADRQNAQAEAAAATAAQMEEMRIRQAREQQYQQDLQRRQDALQRYESASVDSGRLFSGTGGTLRAIGAALAAGAGAYGAALARTPNYALSIMENSIDRDIREQELEIQKKGQSANNALAELQRSGLDRDQAVVALHQAQLRRVAAYNQWTKASFGGQDTNAQHDAIDAELERKAAELDLQFQTMAHDKVGKNFAYAAPQRGSPGGIVRTGAVLGESGNGSGEKPISPATTEQLAAANAAYSTAADIEKELEDEGDSGYWEPSGSVTPSWMGRGAKYNQLNQKMNKLTAAYQTAELGKSDADAEHAKEIMRGNDSVAGWRQGLSSAKKAAINKATNFILSQPPEQRERAFKGLHPGLQRDVAQELNR